MKDSKFSVGENCTNITFNVYSPHYSEKVNLFADGPCGNFIPSIRHVDIQFTTCTCPVGFEHLSSEKDVNVFVSLHSPLTSLVAIQQLIQYCKSEH